MFFRDAKASYDTANIGNLRLVPQDDTLQDIRSDYKAMDEMFMGSFPSFDEIIKSLALFEARINAA
ncbi:MAG: hypothetical protein VR65_04350 [Desulfobulbaceae bacterium BRH_c16a]|nr:MAG: hypothetical protein VR65_04350 [Desulfobulbaceae bacterium BRH_c16a]